MRQLDLLRYGHFTDRSLELPAGASDFHIIFGPNEAGKSTALSAIEDLLFGIHGQTPYGFLDDYGSMRIGAVLEYGSDVPELLRRKGNKDTLLGPEGSPVPGGEAVLRPYLAGADRTFFERMFSLDHTRLEAGGREILEAKDDVGQMLFSAGAGIGGLRVRLTQLSTEADSLWSPGRRARHRKFSIAEDKLDAAQRELREQTLTAAKWRELKKAHEGAEEAYGNIDKAISDATTSRNRLSRIRRVLRDVRRKQELDRLLEELGDVIALPEDAAGLVAESEREDAEAAARVGTMTEQLQRAEEVLEKLTYDETIFQRAADVRQACERRIEVRAEKADLPKRETELQAAERELKGAAAELGWRDGNSAALIERIPPRPKVSVVRSLLNQKGELERDVSGKARLLEEAKKEHAGLKDELAEVGDPRVVDHDISLHPGQYGARTLAPPIRGPVEGATCPQLPALRLQHRAAEAADGAFKQPPRRLFPQIRPRQGNESRSLGGQNEVRRKHCRREHLAFSRVVAADAVGTELGARGSAPCHAECLPSSRFAVIVPTALIAITETVAPRLSSGRPPGRLKPSPPDTTLARCCHA